MLRRRYTIRALLLLIAGCAAAVAAWQSYREHHACGADLEHSAIDKYVLDIYGYETENSLPDFLASWLPADIRRDFEHITEIDLQFNDLFECDPRDVVDLHACKWVHTLRVPNATMTHEMFDAVIGFPNLREIHVTDWYDRIPTHDVTLESRLVSGVQIVLE